MYQRVKVRMGMHDGHKGHGLHTLLTNSQDEVRPPFGTSVAAEKENHGGCDSSSLSSPPIVARVLMQTALPSVSSNKGSKTPTVDAKATAVLRPRAVLSSPDNDNLIGKRNKLIDSRTRTRTRTPSPSSANRKINFSHSSGKVMPVAADRPKTCTTSSAKSLQVSVTSTSTRTRTGSKPTSVALAKQKKQLTKNCSSQLKANKPTMSKDL
ncbi:hypothetical protein LINGRAHAP2_LOCUS19259 [Linum grandiflorum]